VEELNIKLVMLYFPVSLFSGLDIGS